MCYTIRAAGYGKWEVVWWTRFGTAFVSGPFVTHETAREWARANGLRRD